MGQSDLYKYLNEIDNFEDIAGTDDNNDQLDVNVVASLLSSALASDGSDSLLVDSNKDLGVSIDAQTLSALDTDIASALVSDGSDSLLVDSNTPLSVDDSTPISVSQSVASTERTESYTLAPGESASIMINGEDSQIVIYDNDGGNLEYLTMEFSVTDSDTFQSAPDPKSDDQTTVVRLKDLDVDELRFNWGDMEVSDKNITVYIS